MTYQIRATSSVGAIASTRESAVDAYALAKHYEAEGYSGIVIQTPKGTEYGVAAFYQAMSSGGPV